MEKTNLNEIKGDDAVEFVKELIDMGDSEGLSHKVWVLLHSYGFVNYGGMWWDVDG